jgi:hypothetical protein
MIIRSTVRSRGHAVFDHQPATMTHSEVIGMASNSERGRVFQDRAHRALVKWLGVDMEMEVELSIGSPPKLHRFDLASLDRAYVGEAKAFAWTVSGNIPSAKITTLREAVQYLRTLPETTKTFVIMPREQRSLHPRHRESLAEYFARLNGHILGPVAILEVQEEDRIVVVRGGWALSKSTRAS